MIQTLQVQNIKCSGCAHTLREKLEPVFGKVKIDLDKEPRKITLDIEEGQREALAQMLKSLGYPLAGESMGFVENGTAKAKSFVSCAVGKINQ